MSTAFLRTWTRALSLSSCGRTGYRNVLPLLRGATDVLYDRVERQGCETARRL